MEPGASVFQPGVVATPPRSTQGRDRSSYRESAVTAFVVVALVALVTTALVVATVREIRRDGLGTVPPPHRPADLPQRLPGGHAPRLL